MDRDRLALTLRYHQWADERFLEAAARAGPSAFTRRVESSFPSLRDTLVHILWGQELWLERWQGRSPRDVLDPARFPDVSGLRARWADLHRRQWTFVRRLEAADLARPLSHLEYLRRQRDNPHELSLPQLPRDGPEHPRASRVLLVADQHHRIVVEADG